MNVKNLRGLLLTGLTVQEVENILETSNIQGYFLPKENVDENLLSDSIRTNISEYKGRISFVLNEKKDGFAVKSIQFVIELNNDDIVIEVRINETYT